MQQNPVATIEDMQRQSQACERLDTAPSTENDPTLLSVPSSDLLLLSRRSLKRLSSLDTLLGARENVQEKSLSMESSQFSSASTFKVTTKECRESDQEPRGHFRSTAAEVGFCFSMAITQLLAVCT